MVFLSVFMTAPSLICSHFTSKVTDNNIQGEPQSFKIISDDTATLNQNSPTGFKRLVEFLNVLII